MLSATVYLHLLVSLAARIAGVSSVPVIYHKNSVLGPLGLISDDNIVGPLGIISHHNGIIHPVVPHHVILKAHPDIIQPTIISDHGIDGPYGFVHHHGLIGPHLIVYKDDKFLHAVKPVHHLIVHHPHLIVHKYHKFLHPVKPFHHFFFHHGPHFIVHKDYKVLHPVKPFHHFVVHHKPHFIVHKDHALYRTLAPVHHPIGHHPAVLGPHKFVHHGVLPHKHKLIHHGVLPHKHKFVHHAVHPHFIAHHGGKDAGFLRLADPEEVIQGPLSELGKFINDMLNLGGTENFGEATAEIPVNYDALIQDIPDSDDNEQEDSEPEKEAEKSEECSTKTSKEIADTHEATSIGPSEESKKGGEVSTHRPDHESAHQPSEGDKHKEIAAEPSTNVAETALPSKEHSKELASEKLLPGHGAGQHVHTSGLSLLPGLQHAGAGVNLYHSIDLGNNKYLTGYKQHEYDHENEDFGFEPNRFCLQVPMAYHHGHHDHGFDTHKFGVEGGGSKGLGKIMGLGGKFGKV